MKVMGDNFLSFLKGVFYTGFVFLEVDLSLFNILWVFMIIDTIVGLLKILKLDKSKFSMKILMWGMVSKMGLLLVPLIVALLLKGVGQEMGFGIELILKILIVSEFISTIGNIYTIKTGKIVKDIDIFSMLFKFLRCRALQAISTFTKNDIYTEECGKIMPQEEEEKKESKEGDLEEGMEV